MNGHLGSLRWLSGKCSFCLASAFISILIVTQMAVAPPGGNWRERALAYADSQHMFGQIQTSGQSYTGSFVRFRFDQTAATISDYSVMARSTPTAVFQTVVPEFAALGVLSVNGTVFEYTSAPFVIAAFNNPTSALLIRSNSTTINVTFSLSSGVDADRNGQSLNLSTPSLIGRLFVTGAATISLVGFQAVARLPPGTVAVFRANSVLGENVAGDTGQIVLADAAVGGLLSLESFFVGFEGYVEASDVKYGGTTRLNSNLTAYTFTVDIEVEQMSSRLFALHVHKSMIGQDIQAAIQVQLDGTNVTMLASLEDVVADSGTEATYARIVSGNGTLILLRIPDMGGHVLSVLRSPPTIVDEGLNPLQFLAIAAIILVLLGAAAAFMLRRRPAQ